MFWPVHNHPDFGYLAPTSRFWKLVRVGAITGTLGLLAGSVGVIALSQRLEIEVLREDFVETLRNTALISFTSSTDRDRAPMPPDTRCSSQPVQDNNCMIEAERAQREFLEKFPETRRRAGASSMRRKRDGAVPAVAMPPATAPPAASSLAAVPPALPSASVRPSIDSRPSGQIAAQAATNDSASSEASAQRLRRKSEPRRRNQARPDTPPRTATNAERQTAGAEGGWNAYDRGWGRSDTGRQSNNAPAWSSERRGAYSW